MIKNNKKNIVISLALALLLSLCFIFSACSGDNNEIIVDTNANYQKISSEVYNNETSAIEYKKSSVYKATFDIEKDGQKLKIVEIIKFNESGAMNAALFDLEYNNIKYSVYFSNSQWYKKIDDNNLNIFQVFTQKDLKQAFTYFQNMSKLSKSYITDMMLYDAINGGYYSTSYQAETEKAEIKTTTIYKLSLPDSVKNWLDTNGNKPDTYADNTYLFVENSQFSKYYREVKLAKINIGIQLNIYNKDMPTVNIDEYSILNF